MHTFSARILSPTSSVGYIDVEGIDLGSAKVDLNKMLTLKAVKAAFTSSELKQIFINFKSQLLLLLPPVLCGKTFTLLAPPLLAIANASEHLLSLPVPLPLLRVPLLMLSHLLLATVPPLSTSVIVGSLQGNHLEPGNKEMIGDALRGEIPKTLTLEEAPIVCFIKEINPKTTGDWVLPPIISPARIECMDGFGLMRSGLATGRRRSE